jgi:hypothetical protein
VPIIFNQATAHQKEVIIRIIERENSKMLARDVLVKTDLERVFDHLEQEREEKKDKKEERVKGFIRFEQLVKAMDLLQVRHPPRERSSFGAVFPAPRCLVMHQRCYTLFCANNKWLHCLCSSAHRSTPPRCRPSRGSTRATPASSSASRSSSTSSGHSTGRHRWLRLHDSVAIAVFVVYTFLPAQYAHLPRMGSCIHILLCIASGGEAAGVGSLLDHRYFLTAVLVHLGCPI